MNPELLRAIAAALTAAPTGQVLHIVEMILELSLIVAKDMPPEMRAANWEQVHRDVQWWRDLFSKVQHP